MIAGLQARTVSPDHESFDRVTQGWNLCHKHEPKLVLLAESEDDICNGLRYAAEHNLPVAVQCTGHGVPRCADGAVLIKTDRMSGVTIDASSRRAIIRPGATMGELCHEAHKQGLMPLGGSSLTIGAVGYLLGGGFPLLAREFGLASDYAKRFRVALASGEVVEADETTNEDLFWALKGGGGAFGIVTEVETELLEGNMLFGGNAIFPYERAEEMLPDWVRMCETLPDSISTTLSIMHFPPLHFIPEFLRGKSVLFFTACAHKHTAQMEGLLQWAQRHSPIAFEFADTDSIDSGGICRDPIEPVAASGRGMLLRTLDSEAVGRLIAALKSNQGPPWFLKAELRKLGGAVARTDHPSPLTLPRQADFLFYAVGPVHPGNPIERVQASVQEVMRQMSPWMDGEGPLGFMAEGKVTAESIRNCYSPYDYSRLLKVKDNIDPSNVFRFSGVGIRD